MSNLESLRKSRKAVSEDLEDLEFEQFAVMSGCEPQRLSALNERVETSRQEVQGLDRAISAVEERARQKTLRPRRISLSQAKVDEVFANLIAHVQ